MEVQKGKLFKNRTWRYLYPSLKLHPKLMDRLNLLFKINVGLQDEYIDYEDYSVNILIDTSLSGRTLGKHSYQEELDDFLEWIRLQSYYVKDYLYNDYSHMIIVKLPQSCRPSYEYFLNGEYSKMYNSSQLNTCFVLNENSLRNSDIRKVRDVLTKSRAAKLRFVEMVNEDFNEKLTVETFDPTEYDYPIRLKDEIFNYE